jgi:AcrR family transcriptional regulator
MRGQPTSADPRSLRSREQILAALHRGARDGSITNLSALSTAAGVTRATIYNHFETLEEAAWFAIRDSFAQLLEIDASERHLGRAPEVVGIESLRKVVEMLRAEEPLVRIADTYRSEAVLPGVAGILLGTVTGFRAEFSPLTATEAAEAAESAAEAQDAYVAGGLYAVLSTGAWGTRDALEVARVAYSLLPDWMRNPSR